MIINYLFLSILFIFIFINVTHSQNEVTTCFGKPASSCTGVIETQELKQICRLSGTAMDEQEWIMKSGFTSIFTDDIQEGFNCDGGLLTPTPNTDIGGML